ncbi:MAG: hypothetical protein Q7T18_06760, partial [Sedimentisphaerales bacterium]|nr:hypothetical protein [Sedimentisphaerales bacterium]
MQKSAIFSPILGTKKDSPSILLSENYSPDNSDVRLQDGELWRTLFRGKLLLEKPLAIGSVAATNGSAAVVGTNTAWVKGLKGRVITINSVAYTILSVTDATNLTLTATHTGAYTGTSYLIGTSQTDATTPDGYSILRYHRFVANTTGTE